MGFPQQDGSWMSTNSEKNIVYHLSDHIVIFDPLHMTYIDPIFKNGSCSNTICPLKDRNKIWIGIENMTETCGNMMSIEGYISLGKDSLENELLSQDTNIWSLDLSARTLKNSCIMMYCGKLGLRLYTGEWITVSFYTLNSEQKGFLSDNTILECRKDQKIYTRDIIHLISVPVMNSHLVEDNRKCEETLQ